MSIRTETLTLCSKKKKLKIIIQLVLYSSVKRKRTFWIFTLKYLK